MVAVDLHTAAIEGFFGIPLEHLSAVPMLVNNIRPHVGAEGVVVAPDMGAAELAERYAEPLELPVAIVHKTRISGSEVSVGSVTGEVGGRKPIIVDTGGPPRRPSKPCLRKAASPRSPPLPAMGCSPVRQRRICVTRPSSAIS